MMESSLSVNIASNGRIGEKLKAENEMNPSALRIDPYLVAWKLSRKDKIVAEVVGHVPREIPRFVCFS